MLQHFINPTLIIREFCSWRGLQTSRPDIMVRLDEGSAMCRGEYPPAERRVYVAVRRQGGVFLKDPASKQVKSPAFIGGGCFFTDRPLPWLWYYIKRKGNGDGGLADATEAAHRG